MIVLPGGDSRPTLTAVAFLLGFSLGSEADVLAYLVSHYFVAQDFGKTVGWLHGLAFGTGGFSPLFIAYVAAGPSGYSRRTPPSASETASDAPPCECGRL